MEATLSNICGAVFWITPPALLLLRFIWPTTLARPVAVVAIALLSWATLALEDELDLQAELNCIRQSAGHTGVGCPIVDHWYTYKGGAGWVIGLIYSLPWFALYAGACVVREHLQRNGGALPNTSLERTRER